MAFLREVKDKVLLLSFLSAWMFKINICSRLMHSAFSIFLFQG